MYPVFFPKGMNSYLQFVRPTGAKTINTYTVEENSQVRDIWRHAFEKKNSSLFGPTSNRCNFLYFWSWTNILGAKAGSEICRSNNHSFTPPRFTRQSLILAPQTRNFRLPSIAETVLTAPLLKPATTYIPICLVIISGFTVNAIR